MIKKSIVPGAPIQDPDITKAEIEADKFVLAQPKPYKKGVFIFNKMWLEGYLPIILRINFMGIATGNFPVRASRIIDGMS